MTTTLEPSFPELFDSLLYTARLARVAGIADYIIMGREETDEKRLGEVRDRRSEMIEFTKIMAEVNRELVKMMN